MKADKLKLVVVVAEAALERALLGDLRQLGVTGYTITDARGSGSRGWRGSGWEHTSNIRLEVLCEPAVAERIVNHVRDRYESDYAMIFWVQDAMR